jgi:nitroreductase
MPPMDYLLTRRSVKANALVPPAPDEAQLEQILTAATRVPDHGKLCPWRILVLGKEGQGWLGEILARRFASLYPQANEKQLQFERERPLRAPLLLVVLATPVASPKAPEWEQHLSAGAVCMNILHAAHALGFGANWLTEWPAYDDDITAALLARVPPLVAEAGGRPRVAGFMYLGSIREQPEARERPALKSVACVMHDGAESVSFSTGSESS